MPPRGVNRTFQTAVLVLLVGGLGGCVGTGSRPAEPQPSPCASRFPTTERIWSGVGQGTEDQVSACFASHPDEAVFLTVFRSVFVCSAILVTPPFLAGAALVFTPLTVPADLVATSGCAEIGAPEPVQTAPAAAMPDPVFTQENSR